MTSKTKKYRVSLALAIPSNYEIEVEAENEEEALENALEDFYGEQEGDVINDDYTPFSKCGDFDEETKAGIFIEETK